MLDLDGKPFLLLIHAGLIFHFLIYSLLLCFSFSCLIESYKGFRNLYCLLNHSLFVPFYGRDPYLHDHIITREDFKIMGRGRGKAGKKLTVTNQEDPGSGDEEKVFTQKRRGRPQKPLKDDDFDEDGDVEKIEGNESDNMKNGVSNKEVKSPTATEHGKKRKRNSQVKEKLESVEEGTGNGNRSSTDNLTKVNGLRQNGSRRKSTPRRAAEAGVQCK